MKSKWSDEAAASLVARYGAAWGEDLALRTYSSRLIGAEMELDRLTRLRKVSRLSDETMVNQFRLSAFDSRAAAPSIETFLHAFIPAKFIDHTHADAILTLTNQVNGITIAREALGDDVVVVDYLRPGFDLAVAAAGAYEKAPESIGIVLAKHGLVTWGRSARESYERTIGIVTRAESYISKKRKSRPVPAALTEPETARNWYLHVAPVLRGALATRTEDDDRPFDRVVLRPLITSDSLALVDSGWGKEIALTPPLTADHLIRTKPFPLWIDLPAFTDPNALREVVTSAVDSFANEYAAYFDRHSARLGAGLTRFDLMPRVVFIPGIGAVCAGKDVVEAGIVRDITTQTLAAKAAVASMGVYEGLSEDHLFDMEYFTLQHAKLEFRHRRPLRSSVALVTGAAGAIGAGICEGLLEQDCHVAVSDLHGDALSSLTMELKNKYSDRVFAVPLDVTDPDSVSQGFGRVIQGWGGIDIVVANAGAAHVASLAEMKPEDFRRLERVNTEGTLNILSEAGRHFKLQGTGGDIVLVSTKNVFAPGARFGAYSATKAAAHQLARIASLELAEIDVRVNMVSPDAVFSHGDRRSGLWTKVGPDRMRARGLDEKGLEEYYRRRNLLRARVTADHVARAVVFFVTRQTPTTGATLPVDGGLPDATPR
ncbi:MAG: bifunctional aldolase/short-chain dehydrogenase [bacterium]